MENKLSLQMPGFVESAFESIEEMNKVAQLLLDSKFVPDHFYEKGPDKRPDYNKGKVASVATVLIKGHQLGMHPMTALQEIVPVNGLLSIKGDGAKGLILQSGKIQKGTWKEEEEGSLEREDYKVTISATRSDTGEAMSRSFSVERAKRAGLWIDQKKLQGQDGWRYRASAWYKYPDRMIKYRALGFLARDLFPDVLSGTYTLEEAQDMPVDQTIEIETDRGAKISIPDREFAQERSETLTQKAAEKIEQGNDARKEQLIYQEAREPEAIPPALHWTEEKLSNEKAEHLAIACARVPATRHAMDVIPGRNTNKKLRTIILAWQKGTLNDLLIKYGQAVVPVDEPEDTGEKGEADPMEGDRMDSADIEAARDEEITDVDDIMEPMPGDEGIEPNVEFDNQPEGVDVPEEPGPVEEPGPEEMTNHLGIEVTEIEDGGERPFEEVAPIYQAMIAKGAIDENRFGVLNKKLFDGKWANKQEFCKKAPARDIHLLINSN